MNFEEMDHLKLNESYTFLCFKIIIEHFQEPEKYLCTPCILNEWTIIIRTCFSEALKKIEQVCYYKLEKI